jgi:thiamine-phosphate pyrophosphorylase
MTKLYSILDLDLLARISGNSQQAMLTAASAIFTRAMPAGAVQLRAKNASPQETLAYAAAIREARSEHECTLILNDRPDLVLLAGFDGCHLGQEDLSIAGARKILRRPKVLGLSTHNQAQVEAGDATDADYLAIGPIFTTTSKQNAEPTIGLAEFARLRKLTTKPVVAIGGITRDNAKSVLDAGADSVAMIGDLYRGCTADNFAGQLERNLADILLRIL